MRKLVPIDDRNPYMHIFNPDAMLTDKDRRGSKGSRDKDDKDSSIAWSIVKTVKTGALDTVAEALA